MIDNSALHAVYPKSKMASIAEEASGYIIVVKDCFGVKFFYIIIITTSIITSNSQQSNKTQSKSSQLLHLPSKQ
jgi:hypothetical protein